MLSPQSVYCPVIYLPISVLPTDVSPRSMSCTVMCLPSPCLAQWCVSPVHNVLYSDASPCSMSCTVMCLPAPCLAQWCVSLLQVLPAGVSPCSVHHLLLATAVTWFGSLFVVIVRVPGVAIMLEQGVVDEALDDPLGCHHWNTQLSCFVHYAVRTGVVSDHHIYARPVWKRQSTIHTGSEMKIILTWSKTGRLQCWQGLKQEIDNADSIQTHKRGFEQFWMLTASKTGRTMLSGSEKGKRLCCHGLNQEEDNANRVWNRKRTMLTGSEMGRGQSWQSEAIDWGQCWQSLKQMHSGSHRTTLTGYEMTMLTRSELRRGLYLEGLVLKADKQRADSNLQKGQKMQSVVQHSSPWYSHHSWLRFILKRGHCSGQRLVDWLPPPPPHHRVTYF